MPVAPDGFTRKAGGEAFLAASLSVSLVWLITIPSKVKIYQKKVRWKQLTSLIGRCHGTDEL